MEQDIKKVMWQVFQNDPAGVKVFEHLSSRFYDTGLYSKGDPYDTAYRIGQRDVITYIINSLAYATITPQENEDE